VSGRACDVLEVPLPLSQATRVRLPHPHIFAVGKYQKVPKKCMVVRPSSFIINISSSLLFTFTRAIIRARVPTTYDT
jgi:hypothetical protein